MTRSLISIGRPLTAGLAILAILGISAPSSNARETRRTLDAGLSFVTQAPVLKSAHRSLPSQPTMPEQAPEVQGATIDCNVIDFEGGINLGPVGVIPGPVTVTFGPSWLNLVDGDAGGSGNFANEPSPETIAFFLASNDPINFTPSIGYIEMQYVAASISVPVTLTAYDGPNGTGNVVGTAVGNDAGTSDVTGCTGDPSGSFCSWFPLVLDNTPAANIASIVIAGAVANQFGFDDMTFCIANPDTGGGGDCDLGPIEAKLDLMEPKLDDIGATQADIQAELRDAKAEITDLKAELRDVKAEIVALTDDIRAKLCEIIKLNHTPHGLRVSCGPAVTSCGETYSWNSESTGGSQPDPPACP